MSMRGTRAERTDSAVRRVPRVWLVLILLAVPVAQVVARVQDDAIGHGESLVRVGLATDEPVVVVEDERGLEMVVDGRVVLNGATRLAVRPGGNVVHPWTYRLQVAAMREKWHAESIAAELQRRTGLATDLAFDAETGLTRVRLGAWHERSSAEAERARLKAADIDAWVIEEPGRIDDAGLEVTTASLRVKTGPQLRVRSIDGSPITWGRATYRGDLGVVLNRRGRLNVVLHSRVEDYLRGVVPREMGPRVYDDLDALKAQAVAARSYVLHNLGEFEAEGFDVCATTRCQVFGGVAGEQSLTDRAVRETSGLVLMTREGVPADTLYTATCGGHTENVETVFPEKRHPYLRGVPCVESGRVRVATRSTWNLIESRVVEELIGELGSSPRQLEEAFYRLMHRAGIPVADDQLTTFERDEVTRFLGSVLDLVIDPAWLTGGRAVASGGPPLAQSLQQMATGEGRVTLALLRRILYQTGEITGLVRGRWVGFLSAGEDGGHWVGADGERVRLPTSIAWHWSGRDSAWVVAAGDPLHLIQVDGDPLAVLVPGRVKRSEAGAPSTRRWSEFRSDRDLASMTAAEFPGFRYQGLELGARGVSGRVGSLRLSDGNGGVRQLRGLAVRWFLRTPETLFTSARRTTVGTSSGWLFEGRGWGHGVGMCQRGAYRMALRGARFDEILGHYYTGLRLGLYDPGRTGR